jgi:WD40 repeat protein
LRLHCGRCRQRRNSSRPPHTQHGTSASGSKPATNPKYDIYRGAVPLSRDAEDWLVGARGGAIGFGATAYPVWLAYTRDGASMVTGSADGLVEVYDSETLRLRGDLPYQARDEFMIHETAVLAACVGRDGDLLATGDKDGLAKVWRLSTGECVRRFPAAHAAGGGVACMTFGVDGSQLLTGGHDGLARVHGLRSGKTIREYRGHTAPVTAALFTGDGSHVVTALMVSGGSGRRDRHARNACRSRRAAPLLCVATSSTARLGCRTGRCGCGMRAARSA